MSEEYRNRVNYLARAGEIAENNNDHQTAINYYVRAGQECERKDLYNSEALHYYKIAYNIAFNAKIRCDDIWKMMSKYM